MEAISENVIGSVATGVLLLGTSMIDVSDPIVVGIGGTILAGLTGAIKVLWDRNNALSKATADALGKCEEEHKNAAAKYDGDRKLADDRMNVLIEKVITLSGEVGVLKGRIQGFQEATEKAERDAHNQTANSGT